MPTALPPGITRFQDNDRGFVKFCSSGRGDLEAWATGTVGGEVTICPTCLS
jgi:hypothetical protein